MYLLATEDSIAIQMLSPEITLIMRLLSTDGADMVPQGSLTNTQ